MRRIKILDSCRGMAALIVVFHHVYTRFDYLYNAQSNPCFHTVLRFISECNREAVLFFFMLSGFSIRLSLYKGMPLTKDSLNNYLFRRFNRIVPLYLIAIAAAIVTGAVLHQLHTPDFSLFNLFGNLLFLQISKSYKGYWFSPYGDNGPLWSISFEMFYYLFFPVFIFCLKRIFRKKFLIGRTKNYTLTIAFLLSVFSIIINKAFFFPYIAFATLFYVWYGGFFLADLFLEKNLAINVFFASIASITFAALILHIIFPSASLEMLFIGSSISLIFYLLYVVRTRVSSKTRLFTDSAFNFIFYKIGRGSYALYLLHYPLILLFLHYQIQSLLLVVSAMLVLTIICIFLEEYFVKKRFSIFRLTYLK